MTDSPPAPPAPSPQLSLQLFNFAPHDPGSWDALIATAVVADRVGFDRLVVVDHVAFGESLEDYGRPEVGGITGGNQPTGPDGHWLEPLTVLSLLAGRTQRVRLATGILIAALRRPVVLAKTVATLDVLSHGRVDLGVSVGWQRAEYAAAGLDFAARGNLLDASLTQLQQLWQSPVVVMDGVGPIHQMPKPRQPGGVPIWIGGRAANPRVRARIARFGSGWIPWGDDAVDPRPGIAQIRAAMAAAGRAHDPLSVTTALPRDLADVAGLVAAGVTDFRVSRRDLDETSMAAIVADFHEACAG